MDNPFHYGVAVDGVSFCNRENELRDIQAAMNSSERLFIYSERRLGKTSLVLHALRNLDKKRYLITYVDLWATDSEEAFVTTTARAIAKAMESTADRLLAIAKKFFTHLAPTLTAGEDGKPELEFGVNPNVRTQQSLEEVLAAPAKIARLTKRKVVVIFDEFQRILEYGDDHVERLLRSIIQRQSNVGYLFLGSRKHLLQDMFLNQSRPLYRAAGHYPLGPIALEHWTPFITKKFQQTGKRITPEQIETIFEFTEGHPFYTQHFCHALWDHCKPGASVTAKLIKQAFATLLSHESSAYTELWESLAINQRRLLRGLAIEGANAEPFSGAFISRFRLGSASSSQRAAENLCKNDVLEKSGKKLTINDRFFRAWILDRWQA